MTRMALHQMEEGCILPGARAARDLHSHAFKSAKPRSQPKRKEVGP